MPCRSSRPCVGVGPRLSLWAQVGIMHRPVMWVVSLKASVLTMNELLMSIARSLNTCLGRPPRAKMGWSPNSRRCSHYSHHPLMFLSFWSTTLERDIEALLRRAGATRSVVPPDKVLAFADIV